MQKNSGRYLTLVQDGGEVIVTKNGKEVGRFREWGTQNWAEKSAAYSGQGYVPISMKNDFLQIYPETIKKSDTQYIETEEELLDAA